MKLPQLAVPVIGALLLVCARAGAHEDELLRTGPTDRLGEVTFPISCSRPAQEQFNQAVAMLHSFFYTEALKAFVKVTELDPTCAMGSWGVAMSTWYPLWYPPTKESLTQGLAAVDKARVIQSSTQREQMYIAAIGAFYRDFETVDHKSRALAYEKAMQQLYRLYPEDSEAGAFYALALQATANPNDKTYANQLASAAILERLFAEQPNHPGVAHYLIHAYDYPELAPRALTAARRYGRIAPAMPHALHMPSHTFIALGLWQESIQSNLAAKAAAQKAGWIQEQLHSMDYLVYAYLQGAQLQRASGVLEEFKAATVSDKTHTLATDYSLAAAPARFAVEQRRWSDAAALEPRPSRFPVTQATTYFARALGAAHTGAIADGTKDMQQIATLRDGLLQAKQEYWAKQLDGQRVTAEAWLAWAQGNGEAALALMRTAADLEDSTYKHPIAPAQLLPARELLGDMLLALGKPDQALIEYEASIRVAPNRFNGLYGAAQAAELAGNRKKAATYYAQLLAVCEQADTERPEAQHARLYLAGN